MKASELRITNYLKDQKGRLCEIYELRHDEGVKARAIEGPFTSLPCEPIPLTEEWLLNFGFEQDYNCFVKSTGQLDLIIFSSDTLVAKANDLKPGEFYFCFHKIIVMIKYVHQLQNLYFALTGEELILKPKP
jgi:hypothetical protein